MADRPILKLKMPKPKPVPNLEPTAPPTGTKLKLKFGKSKKDGPAAADASTGAASPKIKLNLGKKKPTALDGKAGKAGKAGKTGKKREHDDEPAEPTPTSAGIKRIKLTNKGPKTPITPSLKLKAKGKPPIRPMGIGYDSEASDAEVDPHIEEEFVLRMQPGEDCEYVRNAIANKKIGLTRSEGGADVKLKFLRQDGRRAVLYVRGNMYAAGMVDLPCIVEGMKSWDKKGWWKTADICQMLLVLGPVKSEEEALNKPYPQGDVREGSYMYEHGLTPPMRWVRKRRFRKRVSTNIVVQVEQAVEDLFRRDAEAISSDYKMQTLEEANEEKQREQMLEDMEGVDYFDDAEGEYDDQVTYEGEVVEGAEEEEDAEPGADEWEQFFEDGMDEEADSQEQSQAATPIAHVEAHPANTDSDAATPGTVTAVVDADDQAETPAANDDADDSGSDADEDDEDEDANEEQLETQRQRDEIADLENAIKQKRDALAATTNQMLKKRQMTIIKDLEQSLALKKAAIGEEDED